MSEKVHQSPANHLNHRRVVLAAGLVATGMSITAAAAWSARRLAFEHTVQRFTDTIGFLEDDTVAEKHDAVFRRAAAISLVYPQGASREQYRRLLSGPARGQFGETVRLLRYDQSKVDGRDMYIFQSDLSKATPLLAPHPKFVDTFLAAQSAEPPEAPKLTKQFQEYYEIVHGFGTYDHQSVIESLRKYASDPGVFDLRIDLPSDNS